jgi:hypothetical protein
MGNEKYLVTVPSYLLQPQESSHFFYFGTSFCWLYAVSRYTRARYTLESTVFFF